MAIKGIFKKRKRDSAAKPRRTRVETRNIKHRRRRLVRQIILTLILVLIATFVVLTLVFGGSSSLSVPENLVGTVITKVEGVVTSAVSGVRTFFEDWHSYDTLKEEYDSLTADYAALSVRYDSAEEIRLENQRLNEILNAQSLYTEYPTLFARVIAREAGQWFDTFTIDVGSGDGVEKGMAVVNADGLVGIIDEVGITYSKVVSIIDSRSAIAVLIQSTRDNGIMKGQVESGTGTNECSIYYLPDINSISVGDTVVTSGADSKYPKGITVGYISALSINETSSGTYAVLTPAADFRRIEEVLVLMTVPTVSDEQLSPITTVAPAATATPTPAPTDGTTPAPTGDEIWIRPTALPDATATPDPSRPIFDMKEDEWAEG